MDKNYWKEYYTNHVREKSSNFASFLVDNYSICNKTILDLGCGDGLDSIFFYEHGLNVISIDQSVSQDFLDNYKDRIKIIKDDFTKFEWPEKFDYVFARFIFHAIDDIEEDELLPRLSYSLNAGGRLFIEARSIHNDVYLKNSCMDLMLFRDNHWRRFIRPEGLVRRLTRNNFSIEMLSEDKGFSPTEIDDQLFLRVIAKRQNY